MWKSIKQWIGGLFSGPNADQFQARSVSIDAFTDPALLPAEQAVALIDAVVAGRSDANTLREALSVRFIKERGIDMYGTTIQDSLTTSQSDPDMNPNTLYVSPYARPTAGAIGMLTAQDPKGETYVALVKNWNNPKDHSKGIQPYWRFPGGYMNVRQPNDPANIPYDHNLEATLKRELTEELGIDVEAMNLTAHPVTVRSDCGAHIQSKTHAIDAFYVMDASRQSHTLPTIAAKDDVAASRWVRLRDITQQSGKATVMIDQQSQAFFDQHVDFLNAGCDELQRLRMDKQAPSAGWQERIAKPAIEAAHTIH